MSKKRNTVDVTHYNSQVRLDIDRIIALDPHNNKAYFEFAVWDLSDEEFDVVWEKWLGYDEDNQEGWF